jgi:hypothetical protein
MLDLLERKAFGLLPAVAHLGSALLLFRMEVENCAGTTGEKGIWLVTSSCSPWLCVPVLHDGGREQCWICWRGRHLAS